MSAALKSVLAMLAIVFLWMSPVEAQDNSEGFQLAAACASCHGMNGSAQGIPKIAGLEEKKIIASIMAYRASETPSHVMHAVGLSLSDDELANVARYLAARGKD